METWKNSQEVPKKWANKFSKLLIRGFKQCWDFPGWDSHHLHQQLLDPLLGPWLIPNCTAQVGFSGGFSCWLLEDILHHFRGSLSEFIPWFTRFFFFTSHRWCRLGFLNHQPRISVFSSFGWPHCAGSAAGTGHSLQVNWLGEKVDCLGKKWQKFSLRWCFFLTNPFEIRCTSQIGNHSFSTGIAVNIPRNICCSHHRFVLHMLWGFRFGNEQNDSLQCWYMPW